MRAVGLLTISPEMRIPEGRITALAEGIAAALAKQHYVRLKVKEKEVAARIARLINENLRAEQALEEEAERFAEKHARQMQGMDQRKVIEGIKARIAKERGFTL